MTQPYTRASRYVPRRPATRQLRSAAAPLTQRILTKNKLRRLFVTTLFAVGLLTVLVYSHISSAYASSIVDSPSSVNPEEVALVFGAAIDGDGPSGALRQRLDTAWQLYDQDLVDKVLVSGAEVDGEVSVMASYLLDRGVEEDDLLRDDFGTRTYDSCYHARHDFDLSKAVLVSQQFHLSRAVYLCSAMGMEVQGLIADNGKVQDWGMWVRDFFAMPLAVWDVTMSPPPVMANN